MVWNDIEWPVVALLSFTSFLLGTIGYLQQPEQNAVKISLVDCIYRSLQLFTMQSNIESGLSIPITLQIARFLSPALAVYTLFQAFMVVFKEQLELFRLVRVTNHAIVCGLGQKGLHLAKDLRKANRPVVVIEQDGNNPHLEACREIGAIVVIGNARDNRILLKAGIRRAKNLLVVCGEDGTNVEVTEQAQKLLRGRRKKVLTCFAHIADTYLWTLLREREFAQEQSSFFRFEMFNVYDAGARILLRDTFKVKDMNQPPHLLIIGMGDLAENLIIHAAREWRLQGADVAGKLLISVIDPDVERRLETLQIRFPLLRKLCEFNLYEYHTNWPEFQNGGFLQMTDQPYPITHAYICFDNTPLGLLAGFTLLRLLPDKKTQIMVRMSEDAGLAAFLKEIRSTELKDLSAFGLLDRTCKIGLLDDGTHEALARVIHGNYVEKEKQKGNTVRDNPSMAPWDELPDELKESNRRQADHIGIKLAATDCRMAPWQDYGKEKFFFKPEEIEKMAELEHTRWCEEKIMEGWEYGEKRDDSQKIHPDLIAAWDDPRLEDDEAKEKDRGAVKLIPYLLAQAGFQIYRLKGK